jgi:hypothetical protein
MTSRSIKNINFHKLNNKFDAPPNSWIDSITNPKVQIVEGQGIWGTFPGSQHFGGRGACWSSEMGTKMNDKWVNHSHELTQTKK